MKSLDDALEVRGRIFGAFEMASLEPDPEVRRRWLTFVVVGAGPTGVEMAGRIAELSRRSLHHNFRKIDPASARVVLLELLEQWGQTMDRACADISDPAEMSPSRCGSPGGWAGHTPIPPGS